MGTTEVFYRRLIYSVYLLSVEGLTYDRSICLSEEEWILVLGLRDKDRVNYDVGLKNFWLGNFTIHKKGPRRDEKKYNKSKNALANLGNFASA